MEKLVLDTNDTISYSTRYDSSLEGPSSPAKKVGSRTGQVEVVQHIARSGSKSSSDDIITDKTIKPMKKLSRRSPRNTQLARSQKPLPTPVKKMQRSSNPLMDLMKKHQNKKPSCAGAYQRYTATYAKRECETQLSTPSVALAIELEHSPATQDTAPVPDMETLLSFIDSLNLSEYTNNQQDTQARLVELTSSEASEGETEIHDDSQTPPSDYSGYGPRSETSPEDSDREWGASPPPSLRSASLSPSVENGYEDYEDEWQAAGSPDLDDEPECHEPEWPTDDDRVNHFDRWHCWKHPRFEEEDKGEDGSESAIADDEIYQGYASTAIPEGGVESPIVVRNFALENHDSTVEYGEVEDKNSQLTSTAVTTGVTWVAAFLSRPNEAEYPPTLSLMKQIELQQLHVLPLLKLEKAQVIVQERAASLIEAPATRNTEGDEEARITVPETLPPTDTAPNRRDKIIAAFTLAAKYSKKHKVEASKPKPVSTSTIDFNHLIRTADQTFLSSTPLSDFLNFLSIDDSDGTITRDNVSAAFEDVVLKDCETNNKKWQAEHIQKHRNDLMTLPMIRLGLLTLCKFLDMSCGDSSHTTLNRVVLVWNWAAVEEEKARKEWWREW